MSIPMQVSLPLVLHLRSEMYQERCSVEDFAFIDEYSRRRKSTVLFASILRSIFDHPNWSQLHAFFAKRYSESQVLSDREARKHGDTTNIIIKKPWQDWGEGEFGL